ncbi:hypothetical protein [Nostoc sp.]|uniref:hypothetical protein n=1 Tax=Nostoc sp. TaxID=1180 RepID=UPI002FFC842F
MLVIAKYSSTYCLGIWRKNEKTHRSAQKSYHCYLLNTSLKQPTRGFGLESSGASSQAVNEVRLQNLPLMHDIS